MPMQQIHAVVMKRPVFCDIIAGVTVDERSLHKNEFRTRASGGQLDTGWKCLRNPDFAERTAPICL